MINMSTIYDYSIPILSFEESHAIAEEVYREIEKDVKLNKNCARYITLFAQEILDTSSLSNQPSNEYIYDEVDSIDINDVSVNSKTPPIPIINLRLNLRSSNNRIMQVAEDMKDKQKALRVV